MNWFQAKAYFKYLLKRKHRFNDQEDSLLVSDLYENVFNEILPYYKFFEINDIRNGLLQSKKKIEVSDFGAGSKKFKSNRRSIHQLIKYNASSQSQGELIFRLVNFYQPKNIIELGTSLGIGTLYLALANSENIVRTIEGCPNIAHEADENFNIAQVNNIIQHVGSFENKLPLILEDVNTVDMVYFDGHHDYKATLNYFNQCLPKAADSAVFIFDDIYWSAGMAQAWKEIKDHNAVSITFDFFRFGIAVLNIPNLKEHYLMKRI